ncbi:MAG: hypothetical protein R6V01_03040 [Thermoplasmatota archaeon]
MKGTPISKRESQVIKEIDSRDMITFTPLDIERFLDISENNTRRIIKSMKEKDLIRSPERGKYILTDTMKELDIYEIASDLFKPSYLGFWSALHFHSMTDQVPRKVFMVSTMRKRPLEIRGERIVYVTLSKPLFFGYEKIGRVIVSDREKSIMDSLRHPDHSGGIEHILASIPSDLDLEKLLEYCEMTKSSATASRLGYLLTKKKMEFDRDRLKGSITSYTKLDPKGPDEGKPDQEWKLHINRVV